MGKTDTVSAIMELTVQWGRQAPVTHPNITITNGGKAVEERCRMLREHMLGTLPRLGESGKASQEVTFEVKAE